jgi:NitT/TauT family transport system ATP-binding protein
MDLTASQTSGNGAVKIAVRGVSVDYESSERQRFRALERVDIDLRSGEFVCVVGPSGCGKSTLIGAIAGFLPLQEGSISLDGRPVKGPGADRGVVFQEYALLPWLTVLGNVALGLKIKGVSRAEREARSRHFLQLVGLSDAADKYPHQLSGGMKQRAAVARTLTSEPEIILMDEPFAAIDAQNRLVLQEEVLRLWDTLRLTILFVTHSVDEAVFLADRVIVMAPHPGRVAGMVDVPIERSRRIWPSIGSDPEFLRIRDDVHDRVRALHAARPQ